MDAGRTYGVSDTGLHRELNWTAPWEHLVEESRTWFLLEASEAPAGDNVFVGPTWIDRTDLCPEEAHQSGPQFDCARFTRPA